jgi:hypothetical protein
MITCIVVILMIVVVIQSIRALNRTRLVKQQAYIDPHDVRPHTETDPRCERCAPVPR